MPASRVIFSIGPRRRLRPGLALLETVVAAGLVVTLLTCATPLVLRTARLWKQAQHFQFASDELSGQLDRLLALPPAQRQTALRGLEVSPAVTEVLPEAALDGRVVEDAEGKRLELSLNWRRLGDPPPVKLVGWIRPTEASETADDTTPPRPRPEEASE